MATAKIVKREVEKVVKITQDEYVLTLNKDEFKIIQGLLGTVCGSGYWRTIVGNMYTMTLKVLYPLEFPKNYTSIDSNSFSHFVQEDKNG